MKEIGFGPYYKDYFGQEPDILTTHNFDAQFSKLLIEHDALIHSYINIIGQDEFLMTDL